jgi:hypothetical protein
MQGMTKSVRFLAKDFGLHVERETERAFKYHGATGAAYVLSHYAEHGKQTLLDSASATRLRALTSGMASSPNPESFFREQVAPFLRSFVPGKR